MWIQTNYDKRANAWVASPPKDPKGKVFLNISGGENDCVNLVFTDTIEFATFVERVREVLDEINAEFNIDKLVKQCTE